MISRAFRVAVAATFVFAATPAAAQQFSDSYQFLAAIRDADGAKVNQFLGDKTLRIVNAKDRNGDGAVHIVAKRSDALYLRVLLQQPECNVNLSDAAGNTALHHAVAQNWSEGVQILIRYKANVNAANSAGQTPLIRAVLMHNQDVIAQLLAAGANPDRADFQTGKSARDYAREATRYPAIMKQLADAPKGGGGAGMVGPRR